MREGWKEVDIQSIALKVTSGGTPLRKMSEYYGGSIPWVKTKQVNYNRIYDSEEYLTELGLQNSSAKLIPENSIIIAMYGDGNTAGRCAINKVPVTTNQACCNIIIDQNLADYNFIYYYLSTQYDKLVSLKSGAGQQNLNAQTIKEFVINLPPLETQKKIASILSGYDDLIENNLKRIKILEEMAQQNYEEWFVRMRFPGHESATINPETGLLEGDDLSLPKGWEKVKLGDLGEIVTGKTPSTSKEEYYNGNIPFIKTPDMNGFVYVIETNQYLTQEGSNVQKNKILDKNDLVVSCIGSAGAYALVSRPSQFNQQINGLKFYKKEYTYFTFCYAKGLKEILEALGSNGATMTNVNKGKFEQIDIVLPNEELLNQFHQFAKPYFENILNLQNQNQRLREARDILLPRLMMGMIEV